MTVGQVLLVDKPEGTTSFGVVREVKKRLGARKAGHAGTLDPMATGLLIIALDNETKNIGRYVGLPKTYEAQILIGEKRTTGDREGELTEEAEVPTLNQEAVTAALEGMVGALLLPVPIYSATKQGGEPLYRKVRRGEKVVVPLRTMEVRAAKLHKISYEIPKRALLFVTFDVGSGTYVRSLAEELGKRLGFPATLYNLRRTRVGDFRIEDAKQLSDF